MGVTCQHTYGVLSGDEGFLLWQGTFGSRESGCSEPRLCSVENLDSKSPEPDHWKARGLGEPDASKDVTYPALCYLMLPLGVQDRRPGWRPRM